MKQSAKKRVLVWAIVSAVLVLSMVVGFAATAPVTHSNVFGYWAETREGCTEGNAQFAYVDIKSIEIEWTSGSVTIQQSADRIVSISESGGSYRPMCWKLVDGTLKIYPQKQSFFGFFNFGSKDLTVLLPQELHLHSLMVNAVSADTAVTGISADEISLGAVSGEVRAEQLGCNTLYAQTVSGACRLSDLSCGEIHTETVSGNTQAKLGDALQSFRGKSVSGDISLLLPKNIKGFTATHSSVSGGFSCDFSGVNSGGTFTFGSGAAEIYTDTVSGNTTVGAYGN